MTDQRPEAERPAVPDDVEHSFLDLEDQAPRERHDLRRTVTIVVSSLVAILAVLLLLLATSWLFSDTTTNRRTLTGVSSVEFVVMSGNVEVVGDAARKDVDLQVRRTTSPLRSLDVTVAQSGGLLRVDASCGGLLGPIGMGGCSAEVRLLVPAATTVRVSTAGGRIAATALGGPTRLLSTSGAMVVDAQTGPLQMSTRSGRLDATDLAAPTADLRSETGAVRVTVTTPAQLLAVRTADAEVRIALPAGPYAVTENSAGKVSTTGVTVDPNAVAKVTVTSTSGRVTVGARPPAA